MKKILFTLLGGWMCVSCEISSPYTIQGTVEGKEKGKAFLIRQTGEVSDTFGVTGIENGKFVFTGRTDGVHTIYVAVEGMLGCRLFLENESIYQINFKPMVMPVVEATGKNQRLQLEYAALERSLSKAYQQIMPLLSKAKAAKDTVRVRELETELQKIRTDVRLQKKNFLLEHGNTYFALDCLARQALGLGVDEVKTRFALCSDELKATEKGKYVEAVIPKLAKIAVGAKVPDFTSVTPEGKRMALYAIRSKVKLIDFWSSNCGRCRRENRLTVPLYEKYQSKGFEIISYSLDKKRELWVNAIAQDGIPWVQVSDLGKEGTKEIVENYGVWSLPANLLVDENNCVIARNISAEELGKLLPRLLE